MIISTVAWGIAEVFYKKGAHPNEKYGHLKTAFFVGVMMGIYATIILFTQNIDLKSFPINFVYYLPVASCYILAMLLSFFGTRFIEESIADPIENSSGAIVPILCAIFLKEKFSVPAIIGIVVVSVGVICIGFFDKKGKNDRFTKLGKRLAVFAFAMPFCYMLLDAAGTFLDIYYTSDITKTILINVTEENLEHTANCAYEFTFFLVAIGILIFLKAKKVKIFEIEEGTSEGKKWYVQVLDQKWKLLAALFEVIGQSTYLFGLSKATGIGAVILGAGVVIISVVLSRVFLKEKLSFTQYVFIIVIVAGIIVLSFA